MKDQNFAAESEKITDLDTLISSGKSLLKENEEVFSKRGIKASVLEDGRFACGYGDKMYAMDPEKLDMEDYEGMYSAMKSKIKGFAEMEEDDEDVESRIGDDMVESEDVEFSAAPVEVSAEDILNYIGTVKD
jgi:hypothetical protein